MNLKTSQIASFIGRHLSQCASQSLPGLLCSTDRVRRERYALEWWRVPASCSLANTYTTQCTAVLANDHLSGIVYTTSTINKMAKSYQKPLQ